MAVASDVPGLSQGLRARSEECFGLIDVGGHGVALRLDLSNSPIVTSLKEIEAKPVDLTNQLPGLCVEPLTHLSLRGDIGVRNVLAIGVIRERELRCPVAWAGIDDR